MASTCPNCEREFKSVQAVAGHQRTCKPAGENPSAPTAPVIDALPPFVAQVQAPAAPPAPPANTEEPLQFIERMPLPDPAGVAGPVAQHIDLGSADAAPAAPATAATPAAPVAAAPAGADRAAAPAAAEPAPQEAAALDLLLVTVEAECPDEPLSPGEKAILRRLMTWNPSEMTSLPMALAVIVGRRILKHEVYGPKIKAGFVWCIEKLVALFSPAEHEAPVHALPAPDSAAATVQPAPDAAWEAFVAWRAAQAAPAPAVRQASPQLVPAPAEPSLAERLAADARAERIAMGMEDAA